jgi:hypothetical protein
MQVWRTRHDIRGICFDTPLQGGVSQNSFNPFSLGTTSASGGLGPLQANANIGLFQVPIQASFLNPSATSTFAPDVTANPNITQGPFGNSLIMGPQIGGGQNTSAGLFGGGGGGKTGGGNISDNITYSPTTTLVSNLPPPLQGMAAPNILQGGVSMQAPHMMPMPNPNSPMGMMMNTTQPIAAGGISPVMAAVLAGPQQQQQAPPGQMVIPGSASYAGGYDQPPMPQGGGVPGMPPMPQGGGMPQMQQGGMDPMALMRSMASPTALALPPLQSQQATPDNSQQGSGSALQAGAGEAVAPDQPISQSAQATIDELERLKGQVSPAAAAAIDNYTKSIAAKLTEHKANEDILRPKLKQAEAERDDLTQKALDGATPAGSVKTLQDTKRAIFDKKEPAEQRAIERGIKNLQYKGSVHPKLRTALGVAGLLGNTGIARAARAVETRMETRETKEEKRDDDAAKAFLTEVHQSVSEQHANLATGLTGKDNAVTDLRTQANENDENLRRGIANSKDMYMEPAKLKEEALGKEASMASAQETVRSAGTREAAMPIEQAIQRGNLQAHQLSAASGAANAVLGRQKFGWEQNKYGMGEPGRVANQVRDLTGALANIGSPTDAEGKIDPVKQKQIAGITKQLNETLKVDASQFSPEQRRTEAKKRGLIK